MSRQPRTLDTLALAVSQLRAKGPSPHLANELAGDVLPVIRAMHAALLASEKEHADLDEDAPLDAGCVQCTSGATPYNFDTGPCAHHQRLAALAAFDAGALPAPNGETA